MMNNKTVLVLSSLTVGVLTGLGYLAVQRLRNKEEQVEEESE